MEARGADCGAVAAQQRLHAAEGIGIDESGLLAVVVG
jgi:hypothetical protein